MADLTLSELDQKESPNMPHTKFIWVKHKVCIRASQGGEFKTGQKNKGKMSPDKLV